MTLFMIGGCGSAVAAANQRAAAGRCDRFLDGHGAQRATLPVELHGRCLPAGQAATALHRLASAS